MKLRINEGVSKSVDNTYVFNFNDDNENDIVKVSNPSLKSYKIDEMYFYLFGYEFNTKSSKDKTDFIRWLKSLPANELAKNKDIFTLVKNSVRDLNKFVVLQQFDLIIYPESSSPLTKFIVSKIKDISIPDYSIKSIELVKKTPKDIELDEDKIDDYLDTATNKNGELKYPNENMKSQVRKSLSAMLDKIHSLNYMSIAKDVKPAYRNLLLSFYKVKDEKSRQLIEGVKTGKILIVDDIVTTGVTIKQILKTINTLNPASDVVVYSLFGKMLEKNV